eukprot:CAMPEP_0169161804 /NCGR_PEP_ID=MMETSP1015-20121227/57263_1 /TAXON_ID=342587 /ORGANISM="Karlodinium micrum, Strain CCMP2283" /LENGTH=37 /DNA_ID= /DNA_START= /DNA_END= /DNA_ORIENTATION=
MTKLVFEIRILLAEKIFLVVVQVSMESRNVIMAKISS